MAWVLVLLEHAGSSPAARIYAGLAQLAEHLSCKQGVVRSSRIIGIIGPLAQSVRADGS